MYNEFTFVSVVLVVLWGACLVLDLLFSGLLALLFPVRFARAFCWGLLSLIVPVFFLTWGILVDRNRFVINEVEIGLQNLPLEFDGYRLVHISDIHARSFRLRPSVLERAVDRINALDPDMVAFTGDLITISPDELDVAGPALRRIKAKDMVVSVIGNHDYCTHLSGSIGAPDEAGLKDLERREREDLGWALLLNENIKVVRDSACIVIVGVENCSTAKHFPSTGNLFKASEGTDGEFRILLTHDPLHWDAEVLGKDYPLTLSGHTHASQLSFFGWTPGSLLFPRVSGLYREGDQYLYVNAGLGETAFPARIGALPEITLITLRRD